MVLKSLSLINYKNFDNKSFDFNDKINCIVGNNGIGKTNVLDAIYHLSFGKSYFNPVATQNIKHGEEFFVINGDYIKNEKPEKTEWERLPGSYHGSGCTLSSCIAAQLALGKTIREAVAMAQKYTWQTLKYGRMLGKGQIYPDRFFKK